MLSHNNIPYVSSYDLYSCIYHTYSRKCGAFLKGKCQKSNCETLSYNGKKFLKVYDVVKILNLSNRCKTFETRMLIRDVLVKDVIPKYNAAMLPAILTNVTGKQANSDKCLRIRICIYNNEVYVSRADLTRIVYKNTKNVVVGGHWNKQALSISLPRPKVLRATNKYLCMLRAKDLVKVFYNGHSSTFDGRMIAIAILRKLLKEFEEKTVMKTE